MNHAAAAIVTDHGTNNFATIRTTSIVTKQQKEHMQVNIFFLQLLLFSNMFVFQGGDA